MPMTEALTSIARRDVIAALALASMIAIPRPGHAQQPQPPAAAAPPAGHVYVIGPEDVLDIAVWNNAAISRTVPVRPDGKISLPLLNDVEAAGLTPMQLRDVLAKALDPYIPTPEVSVIVHEVHSLKVAVIGEVKTPGRFELKSFATVLDVLAMAGGLTEYADRGRITILRRDGTTTRQISVDYGKLTSRNGTNGGHENLLLRPGDIILVP
jgi:polysaccharide export outer membrane protein